MKKIIPKLLFLIIIITSCINQQNNTLEGNEYLALYKAKEVALLNKDYGITVPVIDKYILVKADMPLTEKLKLIADNLSSHYFNSLKIKILKLTVYGSFKTLQVELVENSNYNGPGSLPSFESWYDYFQGSTGGWKTTIILQESFLQKQYNGDWIDAVEFYYDNEKMGGWDHVFLDGTLYRYDTD